MIFMHKRTGVICEIYIVEKALEDIYLKDRRETHKCFYDGGFGFASKEEMPLLTYWKLSEDFVFIGFV